MTVRRTSSRKPTASGCGASSPTRPASTTTPRTPVATGCGASSTAKGWSPAPAKPKSSSLSDKAQRLLDAVGLKTTGRKAAASTGCGTSTPKRESVSTSCAPKPKPASPGPAPRTTTTRTGC